MSRSGAISRDGVGRDAASRDQPLETLEVPVARGEVNGRGAEIVPFVEDAQISVGGGETARVPETRCSDGRSVGALAVPANIESLSLTHRHRVCACEESTVYCGRGSRRLHNELVPQAVV